MDWKNQMHEIVESSSLVPTFEQWLDAAAYREYARAACTRSINMQATGMNAFCSSVTVVDAPSVTIEVLPFTSVRNIFEVSRLSISIVDGAGWPNKLWRPTEMIAY